MSDGGPKSKKEREKTKPVEQQEHATEGHEVQERSRRLKDYLRGQELETGRTERCAGSRAEATDAKIRQFRDRSRGIERHPTIRMPEHVDPMLRGRLGEARLDSGLPQIDSGYLLAKHPDTGEITATGLSKLPQGGFELTGNFVHRSGNHVEMRPRYPETDSAIESAWRRRENKPLVDIWGGALKMDPRQREREKKTNKLLNNWYETYLASGMTLSKAHEKVADDALNILKVTLAPLAGMSVSFHL